jgi:hypothetical protein
MIFTQSRQRQQAFEATPDGELLTIASVEQAGLAAKRPATHRYRGAQPFGPPNDFARR